MQWIDERIALGLYSDATDYVRDLLRRDQEDTSWLRDRIEEGLASHILDAEPEDVVDAVMAEDTDLRG